MAGNWGGRNGCLAPAGSARKKRVAHALRVDWHRWAPPASHIHFGRFFHTFPSVHHAHRPRSCRWVCPTARQQPEASRQSVLPRRRCPQSLVFTSVSFPLLVAALLVPSAHAVLVSDAVGSLCPDILKTLKSDRSTLNDVINLALTTDIGGEEHFTCTPTNSWYTRVAKPYNTSRQTSSCWPNLALWTRRPCTPCPR